MNVRDDLTEQDCRTLIFHLLDTRDDPPGYGDVVAAIDFEPGEMPSAMVRRVYADIMAGLTCETDLEYLTRIGGFPPARYRNDVDAHAAAAAAARAAAQLAESADLDERQRLIADAAARFWTTLT